MRIDLREATTDIQLENLMQGKIDAVLCCLPPLPDKSVASLDYLPVLSEPMVAAIPASVTHGQGGRNVKAAQSQRSEPVSLKSLRELPLIIFPRRISPAFHDTILSCFRNAGVTPHIGQEAIQIQTIVGLVSAGMDMALVPQSVSNLQRPEVDYRPLTGKVPMIETGLAWQRRQRPDRRFPRHCRHH